MSVLRRAVERRSITDQLLRFSPLAGSSVTWPSTVAVERAGTLSAVYASWRLLTDAIGTLPVDHYRVDGERRMRVEDPSWWRWDASTVVTDQISYLVQVLMSLLTDGNAMVATPRDSDGDPIQLVPLDPSAIEVVRTAEGIRYRFGGDVYGPRDVLHIPGMILPGALRGMSPLTHARHVIESGLSAQDYGREFFAHASVPPAVIEIPGSPGTAPMQGPSDHDRAVEIARAWHDTHGGTSNAGKIGVLIGGAKLTTVAIPPEDAQWLESRQFGVSEIARFYGIPPHLLADASNSTSWGSGLSEQNLAFGQFSLRPSLSRIESGHDRLAASTGRPWLRQKLNLDAVLRASLRDRYEAYRIAIDAGVMTPNEARALEDMPPLPGGDDPAPRSAAATVVNVTSPGGEL